MIFSLSFSLSLSALTSSVVLSAPFFLSLLQLAMLPEWSRSCLAAASLSLLSISVSTAKIDLSIEALILHKQIRLNRARNPLTVYVYADMNAHNIMHTGVSLSSGHSHKICAIYADLMIIHVWHVTSYYCKYRSHYWSVCMLKISSVTVYRCTAGLYWSTFSLDICIPD